MKSFLFVSAVFAALTLAPAANASVCTTTDCTYTFGATGVSQFGAGPFGTVELTLNGGVIDFSIDLATGFHLIDNGAHEAFTFNDTLSGAATISAFSDSIYSQESGAGPFANPGYGSFSDAVKSTCTNGGGCGDNTLSFAVSRVGGFTDINQLVSSNGTAYFAADVSNANGNTGAIAVTGVTTTTVTPEPVSSALVGTGLMSLFFLRRRQTR